MFLIEHIRPANFPCVVHSEQFFLITPSMAFFFFLTCLNSLDNNKPLWLLLNLLFSSGKGLTIETMLSNKKRHHYKWNGCLFLIFILILCNWFGCWCSDPHSASMFSHCIILVLPVLSNFQFFSNIVFSTEYYLCWKINFSSFSILIFHLLSYRSFFFLQYLHLIGFLLIFSLWLWEKSVICVTKESIEVFLLCRLFWFIISFCCYALS